MKTPIAEEPVETTCLSARSKCKSMPPVETAGPEIRPRDYSLVGADSARAVEIGLAEADWYTSPVPKDKLRALLARKDGPAIRDCIIYFGLLLASGLWAYAWFPSWWAVIPFMIYGVLYASASDARWHESGHGTAFKTDWLNNLLYEVSSFMVMRESVPWRWSHTRHHSDTIIVGRDPEIAVPRPPSLREMILKCVNFQAFRCYVRNITLHCLGRVTPEEATFIPASEHPKVFFRARIYVLIYAAIAGACVAFGTWLPFLFVLGPNLYGAWLMPIYGWTQHAGLAEDVLDHRLNCRTIRMNFIHLFLYWNMNYHLEHHMFPLVPYHALPRLHELVKADCPEPYPSLLAAYREIIPTVLRQIRDPGYFVRRKLPPTARPVGSPPTAAPLTAEGRQAVDGWIAVCDADRLERNDVLAEIIWKGCLARIRDQKIRIRKVPVPRAPDHPLDHRPSSSCSRPTKPRPRRCAPGPRRAGPAADTATSSRPALRRKGCWRLRPARPPSGARRISANSICLSSP